MVMRSEVTEGERWLKHLLLLDKYLSAFWMHETETYSTQNGLKRDTYFSLSKTFKTLLVLEINHKKALEEMWNF